MEEVISSSLTNDKGKLNVRISSNMNEKQLQDYMERLKQELDVDYIDLGEYYFHDDKLDRNYDNKSEIAKITENAIEFKVKKNQKIIREVIVQQKQNFLAKPDKKVKIGMVARKI